MDSSKAISNLKDILNSLERERESLKHVLLSGKISRETFDSLDKRISKTASLTLQLEKALREEESFWKEALLKGIRIFETLLVELEHKRILDEVEEEEYLHNSEILSIGLSSIRTQMEQNEATRVPPQPSKPSLIHEKNETKPEQIRMRRFENPSGKTGRVKEIAFEGEGQDISEIHCMNPWNPECRNTDIEVSIYYDGRMVPICRRCWEEIANKDVEWSSL